MADLKAMMTKKLGPLPAWGWGVVVGGGYLGYRLLSGKGLTTPAAGASDNMADTSGMTAGGGSGTGSSGGSSSDPTGSYGSGQQSTVLDAYMAGQAASGKETQGSLLEAYQAGETTGLSLIKEPSLAPTSDPPSDPPLGMTPPTTQAPGVLLADPKPAKQSSNGWKIWGVHWKDVAKKRTSTNAGRANTAAYKKGQAAVKARKAAATKKTGTAATGYVKPKAKAKVLPPAHRAAQVVRKPAPAKPAPHKSAAPKKPAPKKPAPKKKGK